MILCGGPNPGSIAPCPGTAGGLMWNAAGFRGNGGCPFGGGPLIGCGGGGGLTPGCGRGGVPCGLGTFISLKKISVVSLWYLRSSPEVACSRKKEPSLPLMRNHPSFNVSLSFPSKVAGGFCGGGGGGGGAVAGRTSCGWEVAIQVFGGGPFCRGGPQQALKN